MALGTGNITLQQVCTEIYGSVIANKTLNDCFTDAIGNFNPTYVGNKDRLSNFKGYTHFLPGPQFVSSRNGYSSAGVLRVSAPAGLAVGDVMILAIRQNSVATINPPTGWGTILSTTSSSRTYRVYWKRYVADDATRPITIPSSVRSGDLSGIAMGYKECIASGTPWERTSIVNSAASTMNINQTQYTSVANCLCVGIGMKGPGTYNANTLNLYTENEFYNPGLGSGFSMVAISATVTTVGGTSNNAFYHYASTNPYYSICFYLKPK